MGAEQAVTGETKSAKGSLEQKLSGLVERLTKTFGDRLVSIVLYGSATTEDWNEDTSDLNVLCVLERISPGELRLAEPIFRWWREAGNPSPLLLTAEEVQSSTDCFPMEFHDMKRQRRILYGADLLRDLPIDNKFYRAQVEHELRSKQLRLRQRAAEILSEPGRLQRLMIDSVSTFCVLGRHALVLSGHEPHWVKKEVVAALGAAMGRPLDGLNEILAVRTAAKRAPGAETIPLLERYLTDVGALVHFVDTLQY